MKIAVMSDIHGNYVALERCIEYALSKGAKEFVFLGDYVGELAYPKKTIEIMERDNNNIILCGHTHLQVLIEYNGKTVLNPGAVGFSLHSSGKAQFMILTDIEGAWEHEFISLDYDVEQVIADLKASGR